MSLLTRLQGWCGRY